MTSGSEAARAAGWKVEPHVRAPMRSDDAGSFVVKSRDTVPENRRSFIGFTRKRITGGLDSLCPTPFGRMGA